MDDGKRDDISDAQFMKVVGATSVKVVELITKEGDANGIVNEQAAFSYAVTQRIMATFVVLCGVTPDRIIEDLQREVLMQIKAVKDAAAASDDFIDGFIVGGLGGVKPGGNNNLN